MSESWTAAEPTPRHRHTLCGDSTTSQTLLRPPAGCGDCRNRCGDPGSRCADLGDKEGHKVCQANQALREQSAKRLVSYIAPAKAVFDTYWVPLAGSEDFYLHFFTDITEYAAERMFPSTSCGESTNGCSSCNCG